MFSASEQWGGTHRTYRLVGNAAAGLHCLHANTVRGWVFRRQVFDSTRADNAAGHQQGLHLLRPTSIDQTCNS